ncbi:MAG TPA: glycosyltransferase family 4 protein, partial [Usitatibacter sp.]|nr:glycosyltransferase family 4 protein [Usitatibacter sp.]
MSIRAMYGLAPALRQFDAEAGGPPVEALRSGGPASRPRPHVCFVAPMTWPVLAADHRIPVVGGAELQQTMVATALARRGYRVSMLCLDYGQPDGAVVDGVTVYKLNKPDEGIPVLRFVHPRLTKLWSAMKRVDADVYYQRCASVYTGWVDAFCARHGKRSVYAGASDVDFVPGRQDIVYARDRLIFEYGLRKVDRVIVQNPLQARLARENFGRESTLIANCFTPHAGAAADPKGCVLWVATLRVQKRPEMLFEMARRMPHYRFVMIGGADPDPAGREFGRRIREQAARLPNLEYKGFLPFAEADRWFDRARVVVNTSEYEGFPNTFLQAWSRGVPTVGFVDTGSRCDGQPVYAIAGDVDEACRHVERLMADDAHWRQSSRRAAAHFHEHHSVEAVVGQ